MASRKKHELKSFFGVPDFMKSAERSSRSSGLAPHYWMMALGAAILLGGVPAGLPIWLIAAFGGGPIMVTALSFALTNRHFALNNPDYLRSEKYNLDKLALQKQLVGDDKQGLREASDLDEIDVANAIDVGTDVIAKIKKPKEEP